MLPALSVIIPAYNAVGTIDETLESLRAQTRADWEAIVVDDGSTDGTAERVEFLAKTEPRFRLFRAPHGGVSAARNRGLEAATADWILYLDADDWIAPDFVEVMCAAATAEVGVVYCDWLRVTPGGSYSVELYESQGSDLFDLLTERCVFAIHCCIIRRQLVEEIGGFDTSLRTAEDWDLWMKAARTGAHFKYVNSPMSFYRSRPGSASLDGLQLLQDGLEILRRAHQPDPRLASANPKYINGAPLEELPRKTLSLFCYVAGIMIGGKADLASLLSALPAMVMEPNADQAAYITLDSVVAGACCDRGELLTMWPSVGPRIEQVLLEIEKKVASPLFARRTLFMMEKLVCENSRFGKDGELKLTASFSINADAPIHDLITTKREVERAFVRVAMNGKEIGALYLPVVSGCVSAEVVRDAISAEYGWAILEHYFAPLYRDSLRFVRGENGMMVYRGELCLGVAHSEAISDIHTQWGWLIFLQELWGCPTTLEKEFYSSEASDLASHVTSKRLTLEVADELPNLAALNGKIEIEVKVGGASIGLLNVDADKLSSAQHLRAVISTHFGLELLIAAVREGVLGKFGLRSLRETLRAAVDQRVLKKSGTIVTRRFPHETGGTISRCCTLPADGLKDFTDLARQAREPLVIGTPDNRHLDYTPDVIASEDISPANYKHSKSNWLSRVIGRFKSDEPSTDRVPILMYHRVAPEGQAPLARYRVAPDRFAEHVDYLKRNGYSTITLESWRRAVESKRPIAGKPVIFTFDDGYLDFAHHAWPILKKHGFGATMFLVSTLIGRTNEWDVKYGEVVPLMDWPDILRLKVEGVEYGSHTATHPYMTGLTPADLVHEAAGSRATLQEKLGLITSLAYPHGDEDSVVRMLTGGCGYRCAVSCEPGISTFADAPMALKRIEVCGTDSVADLARKLNAKA